MNLPPAGAPLGPGHYEKADFRPRVFFAVGDGWTTVQQAPGFFDIEDVPGSLDVVAVQFTTATGSTTAEDAATRIATRPNVSLVERDDVTIGGLSGIRLIIDTTDPADSDPVIFRPVLTTPAGAVSIGSGRRLEVNLFTVKEGVLAILVGGSIAQWDRAEQLSPPVLDSIIVTE
jgi:hypothetical protein